MTTSILSIFALVIISTGSMASSAEAQWTGLDGDIPFSQAQPTPSLAPLTPPVLHTPQPQPYSLYDYMKPIAPVPLQPRPAPQPDALEMLKREVDQERLRQAIAAQQNERANRISHMNACLDISANPAAQAECLKGVK